MVMERRATGLPAAVVDLLQQGGGLVTNSAAIAAGLGRDRLPRLAKAGLLTQLARGCYAATVGLDGLDEWLLFRTRARAFALTCASDSYLVGWAAAADWNLWTLGRPPALPSVVQPKRSGRGPSTSTHGRIRVAVLPRAHRLRRRAGWGVVSTEWAAVDLTRTAPLPHALVVADAAVRAGADLRGVLPHFHGWDGIGRARFVAQHAESNSESPLETLGRFTCMEFNLPMPVSNAWVGTDGPERRLDGLWPYHRAGYEADGALKYNNRPDAADIVRAQHEREFYLRRLGIDLARYGWDVAYPDRRRLADRFAALLRDNPPQGEPVRWWKHVPDKGPVEPEPEDWPSPHPLGLVLPAGWAVERS
jgi:hypothetical protein